jgi:hypothetical protein
MNYLQVIDNQHNKYLKIRLTTKHCAATPRKPHPQGSTARGCVSAIVVNHFLYINIYELAFSQGVMVELWIFVVERLDLYESNSRQKWYPIHTCERFFWHICPAKARQSNRIDGKSVRQD